MDKQINNKPRLRKRKKKKKSNVSVLLKGIFDMLIFLVITTPIVFFWGPYENTRKTLISTVLATRHAYLINDLIPKATLDKLLGAEENAGNEEVAQDMKKINVKYKVGNEVNAYDIHTQRFDAYVLEIKNPLKVKVAMTKFLGKMGQKTSEMAEDNNAIGAINGGSFVDKSSDGTLYAGTGSEPGGFVISEGKVVYPKSGAAENNIENVIAFTKI